MRFYAIVALLLLSCAALVSGAVAPFDANGFSYLTGSTVVGDNNLGVVSVLGDFDSYEPDEIAITTGAGSVNNLNSYFAVADVDGDGITELIYDDTGSLQIVSYVGGNFVIEATIPAEAAIPLTVFDHDNDGQYDIWGCFYENASSRLQMYTYNGTAYERAWSHLVGTASDRCLADGRAYQFACSYTSSVGPACIAVTGDNGAPSEPAAWRLAYNGSVDTAALAGMFPIAGADGFGEPLGGTAAQAKITRCNVDEDVTDEAWFWFNVQVGFPTQNAIGSIDFETFTRSAFGGGNGFLSYGTTYNGDIFNNPTCAQSTGGDQVILYAKPADKVAGWDGHYFQVSTMGAPVDITAGGSHINNIEVMSDFMWPTEGNDDTFDYNDICVSTQDTGTNQYELSCWCPTCFLKDLNIDTTFLDGSVHPYQYMTAQGANLGGDLAGDVVTSAGVLIADATTDSTPSWAESTYSYTHGDMFCAPVELTGDSYSDVVCMDADDVVIHASSNPNDIVDLLGVIPDVKSGDLQCINTNLSLQISYSRGHYTDVERDNIKVYVDWNATLGDGFDQESGYVPYETNFLLQENMTTAGPRTINVCMNDPAHATDTTSECVSFTSSVVDVPISSGNCTEPQQVFPDPYIEEDDPRTTGGPGVGPGGEQQLLPTPDPEGILFIFCGGSQRCNELIVGVVMGVILVATGTTKIIIAGIIIDGIILVYTTLSGIVSPLYLIVMVVMALVAIFIVRPLLGNNGTGG